MTTIYDSKTNALEMGLRYAGYVDPESIQRVVDNLGEPELMDLEFPHHKTIEVYRLTTSIGIEAAIGIGKVQDGFDLWLITPKSGICQRV